MLRFAGERPRRRPNLTPMIDVVFLLLVFFMLASRFGVDRALPLSVAGGAAAAYQGPPRLVEISPGGLTLNGLPQEPGDLVAALSRLMQGPSDAVLLRARDGASLQALVAVMEQLAQDGFTRLVLVE